MTIHTKWMELMRQHAPDAFQSTIPGGNRSQATFIDGQIKLMKAESIQTWAHFIYSQFTCIINRHFNEYGCKTVVLAFDDKRFVPRAKAITQLKRRAGVQLIDFGEKDVLPNDIPSWMEAIMNPHFKNKVIQLVCDSVPHMVRAGEGCRLVVDWQTIDTYDYDAEGLIISSTPEPASAVGEADLKFPYWMKRLQTPMLIEATDGDYIPIAMGLKAMNIHHPVAILKGRRGEDNHTEFIDIDTLHQSLKTAFLGASRGKGGSDHCWEIKLFITLLGLSGTDFTRNLPLVSPVKIWASLPLVAQTFSMDGDLCIDQAQGKRIIELLYSEVYPKHIDPYSRASVWHQAQVSKLGARNKALIPTDARIRCTLRNLNFLMAYWLCSHAPPATEEYGFREDGAGVLGWAD